MKYFFNLNAVFCTAYIGLFVFIVTNIPIETDLFDPISKAFEDFEMSDLVFAQPAPVEDLVSDEVD